LAAFLLFAIGNQEVSYFEYLNQVHLIWSRDGTECAFEEARSISSGAGGESNLMVTPEGNPPVTALDIES